MADVIEQLKAKFNSSTLLTEENEKAKYVTDWSGKIKGKAAAILRPQNTSEVAEIIKIADSANTKVLLMQIRIPPNYGSRYQKAFESIYSNIASETSATLIPFMLEEVALNEELMLPDGIHPKASAQPLIADYVYRQLKPLLIH